MSFPAHPVTERQKKFVAIAGELADIFAKRAAANDWEGKFPLENYKDLQQAGYLTLTVPRDLGGWGANLLEATLAQERLAQGCASTALVMGMHLINVARLTENTTGPNELLSQVCHAVVENGAILNTVASEPVTGSPSRGGRPSTTATRQSDGTWRISGRKTYTTGSWVLQLLLVGCSIEDKAASDSGLPPLSSKRGTFLVPHTASGLHIEETWHSLGMRGTASNDIVLENVHVGPEAHIEAQIPPNPSSQERIAAWACLTTAVYLGIAQAARNQAIQFARQRRPNSLDKPISNLPHIQEKVAKMDLALLQSRAVLFGIAEQFSSDPTSIPGSQFAATKYLVTNHAIEVVDLAMRLVGGASLSLDYPLQRYYRDVRAGLHHPPMDDATITLLGKQALEIE